MTSLVIGLGEIGQALYDILSETYDTFGEDIKVENMPPIKKPIQVMHICIPFSNNFIKIVNDYIIQYKPVYKIIHTSVPVGTTERIKFNNVFHSPVRGKHPDMKQGLRTYVKYVAYKDVAERQNAFKIVEYFQKAGIPAKLIDGNTRITELAKLLSLARYGVTLSFAKEQKLICDYFGVDYQTVVNDWDETYNEGLPANNAKHLTRPIVVPPEKAIGGHCTTEDMELLLIQLGNKLKTPLLLDAYIIGRNTIIWQPCNIYPTAKIGKDCNIGRFAEIGNNVVIGNNVRVGAYAFIPEGVTIEDDVFIAPKVCFTNDKHPPSNKTQWGKILVKKGATIGAGAIILPCITIGENALIGAGAIVTKSIGDNEVWYGTPAYKHGDNRGSSHSK